jgi:hypothetical protein
VEVAEEEAAGAVEEVILTLTYFLRLNHK